jgi:hypothetical protein
MSHIRIAAMILLLPIRQCTDSRARGFVCNDRRANILIKINNERNLFKEESELRGND